MKAQSTFGPCVFLLCVLSLTFQAISYRINMRLSNLNLVLLLFVKIGIDISAPFFPLTSASFLLNVLSQKILLPVIKVVFLYSCLLRFCMPFHFRWIGIPSLSPNTSLTLTCLYLAVPLLACMSQCACPRKTNLSHGAYSQILTCLNVPVQQTARTVSIPKYWPAHSIPASIFTCLTVLSQYLTFLNLPFP
jgi:hypothetical protein